MPRSQDQDGNVTLPRPLAAIYSVLPIAVRSLCLLLLLLSLLLFPLFWPRGSDSPNVVYGINTSMTIGKEACAELSFVPDLDFQDIPKDLVSMAEFFQLTEIGLIAHPKLQDKVNVSQIEVLQLTNDLLTTASDFFGVINSIMNGLDSIVDYLYNSKIKMAIRVYTSVAEEAEKIARKAEDLHKQYNSQLEKLKKILEETFEAQETETKKKYQSILDKQNFSAELNKLEVLKDEAQKKFAHIQSLFYEAKVKEHKALTEQIDPFTKFVNVVAKFFFGIEFFDMGAYRDAVKAAAKAAKNRYFEEMERMNNTRSDATAAIAVYAERMENCDDVIQSAEMVIEAIKKVIGELNRGIYVFVNADHILNHLQEEFRIPKYQPMLVEKVEYKEVKFWLQRKVKKTLNKYVDTYGKLRNFRMWMASTRLTVQDGHEKEEE